jgi:membrane fusion protein, multidrug efflux system
MNSTLPPSSLPPDRTRRRWVLPVLIVAVVALVAAGVWWYRSADESDGKTKTAEGGKGGKGGKSGKGGRFGGGDPNRAQPVTAVAAKVGDINIVQTGLGTVTALRTVTVKPRVDGLLQNVMFGEGQLVKAGDPIAQIDPVPFQVALSQAEGNLARDAATLNNARLDLDRYRTLLNQDSIATQQVDQQASLVKQLEGTVKVDQAQVDNAKLQLSYTRIEAPIGGRLGLRVVDAGNMVRGSDANGVAVITQVDPISVLYTIPQDTLPRILQRLNAGDKPPVEAWDREQKALLAKGTLLTTDNQIDLSTGTVRLKATFANPQNALFPNQFVNVRMVVETQHGKVLVPTAAIQRGNQGAIVYVVKEDGTVEIRTVTTGPTENNTTAVESGLKEGERVITDGVDRIREGAKVEVVEPGGGARTPRAPGDASKGDYKKRLESMSPEQREAFKKKMESMTPEQREEMRKRRQAGEAAPQGKAPQ